MEGGNSIDISSYLKGGKNETLNYEQMVGKLSSEQVREIAIARAEAGKGKDEIVVTIRESTADELRRTKETLQVVPIDEIEPLKNTINNVDIKILQYNHDQIRKFKDGIGNYLFESNQLIKPSNKEENAVMIAFREIYNSDIYDSSTIDKIRGLQKQLGFTGDDLDGEFGPKTQKKLIGALNAPAPVPAAPAPVPAAPAPVPAAPAPVSAAPAPVSAPAFLKEKHIEWLYLDEFLRRNTQKLQDMGITITKDPEGFFMTMHIDRKKFDVFIFDETNTKIHLDEPTSIPMQNALQQYSLIENSLGVSILTIKLGGGYTCILSDKKK